MFEGKPPVAPVAKGQESGDSAGEGLCAISWTDLVAKLAAARDLRAELSDCAEIGVASFDALSAQHLALHHDKHPPEGKDSVNPDDLANGKGPECMTGLRADRINTGNRGNT